MDAIKLGIIANCIETGDWSKFGDTITRNDLMTYLVEMTTPKLDKDGNLLAKIDKCECPLCGGSVKPYAVTLTSRAVKYLEALSYLSKKNLAENGDGYIYHDDIRVFVSNNFKYDKGKKTGQGVNFTSYGVLTKDPWGFIESKVKTDYKVDRDGTFRLTQRGRDFLNGLIKVPERIHILDNKVCKYSNKSIYVSQVKDCNFEQTVALYKTW